MGRDKEGKIGNYKGRDMKEREKRMKRKRSEICVYEERGKRKVKEKGRKEKITERKEKVMKIEEKTCKTMVRVGKEMKGRKGRDGCKKKNMRKKKNRKRRNSQGTERKKFFLSKNSSLSDSHRSSVLYINIAGRRKQ